MEKLNLLQFILIHSQVLSSQLVPEFQWLYYGSVLEITRADVSWST